MTYAQQIEARLFAAAAHVITEAWGDEMGDMQIMTLANQVVREIERRGILPGRGEMEKLQALVAACTRYDEDPDSTINQAAYSDALSAARGVLRETNS